MPFLFPFVKRNLFLSQIVELLLDNGAHIDLRNAHGQRPTSMLRNIPGCQINPLHFTVKGERSAQMPFQDYSILVHNSTPLSVYFRDYTTAMERWSINKDLETLHLEESQMTEESR